MTTFVMLAPIIVQLLAQLPGLIHAAEEAFGSKKGAGPQKKEFVTKAIGLAVDVAGQAGVHELKDEATRKAIVDVAGGLTDTTVAAFNAVGAWKQPEAGQA